jgi:hypothetical protein
VPTLRYIQDYGSNPVVLGIFDDCRPLPRSIEHVILGWRPGDNGL